ncbi:MAG: DUF4230 domain-containing protein [Endomicrobia bacterium]|nr:DUF4230 domain-containing protein [Endomicrobiia bacterium]MCL2798862.1 DUF4230 domain-containing protein [Endomicrobiia bacterium]
MFTNIKYIVLLIIFISTVGMGIFIGYKLGGKAINKESAIKISANVKEILPAAEYVSLIYHYTSIITHSEAVKLFNMVDLPLTGKKALYTIDGTIKMGFDSADIKTEVSYNNIILHMPKIKILSHEIYPETFSLYDEKTSLFNRYSLKDANAIQLTNKKEMELKVRQNRGLYVQARKFAEQQFGALLENLPGIKGEYTIVFEWDGIDKSSL